MQNEGLNLPNPFVAGRQANSGGYFMLEALDGVLLEVFEPEHQVRSANITALEKRRARNLR